jgi:hypothetical protein
VGKLKGSIPFRRRRRIWEDDIKIDLREAGWKIWIDLDQDRDKWLTLTNTVINLWVR